MKRSRSCVEDFGGTRKCFARLAITNGARVIDSTPRDRKIDLA